MDISDYSKNDLTKDISKDDLTCGPIPLNIGGEHVDGCLAAMHLNNIVEGISGRLDRLEEMLEKQHEERQRELEKIEDRIKTVHSRIDKAIKDGSIGKGLTRKTIAGVGGASATGTLTILTGLIWLLHAIGWIKLNIP